ncbi:PEP-CTERM sorting domain-containing protein [Phenylobacterium sp.]|uniref:PEP-CTERM sorting domain-containing protein n=1 Tax=Phenylobacterium sp. TaxID=1871053 RepID=UPI00286CEFBE|nr:PEP-CTERM sorting domain-containing protein [Phenylobacterium sp.]
MLARRFAAGALSLAMTGSAGAATFAVDADGESLAGRLAVPSVDRALSAFVQTPAGPDAVRGLGSLDSPPGDGLGGDRFNLNRWTSSRNGMPGVADVGVASIPEPVAWTMMIAGLGMAGAMFRMRRAAHKTRALRNRSRAPFAS